MTGGSWWTRAATPEQLVQAAKEEQNRMRHSKFGAPTEGTSDHKSEDLPRRKESDRRNVQRDEPARRQGAVDRREALREAAARAQAKRTPAVDEKTFAADQQNDCNVASTVLSCSAGESPEAQATTTSTTNERTTTMATVTLKRRQVLKRGVSYFIPGAKGVVVFRDILANPAEAPEELTLDMNFVAADAEKAEKATKAAAKRAEREGKSAERLAKREEQLKKRMERNAKEQKKLDELKAKMAKAAGTAPAEGDAPATE